jgi:lipopolysaccharide transport system ATP-binding protein
MTSVIQIENISKRYRIRHERDHHGQYRTLRDTLAEMATMPLRRWQRETVAQSREDFWALKDVSFNIEQGEVIGIIGRNGAGKSTLLKILSRITKPTSGHAVVRGRLGTLLEVGTGFHPELTGRENIFLNGSILGMTRREIQKQFDAIVDFSGVEKFLDTPVKRYSSGMYVRLAFAVAAHLNPEILIIDEVLAVGDAEFQKKCLEKMKNVASSGRTILFVTHNMATMQALCTRGVVFNAGKVAAIGSVAECVDTYMEGNAHGESWVNQRTAHGALFFTRARASLIGQQPNLTLMLDIDLQSAAHHANAVLAIDISDATGATVMQAIPRQSGFIGSGESRHDLRVSVELPPLIPGRYLVSLWVGPNNTTTFDQIKECIAFQIHDTPSPGRIYPHTRDHGWIVPHSNCSIRSKAVNVTDSPNVHNELQPRFL